MHFFKAVFELACYMPGTKRHRAERTACVLYVRERSRKGERPSLMDLMRETDNKEVNYQI